MMTKDLESAPKPANVRKHMPALARSTKRNQGINSAQEAVDLAYFPGLSRTGPWWNRVPLVYVAPGAITGIVIAAAPQDAASRWPWLHAFVDLMLKVFPFLGGHAAASSFPSYITLVKCVTLALIPVISLTPFLLLHKDVPARLEARLRRGAPRIPWWNELGMVAVLVLTIVGNWVVGADTGQCSGCTTRSVAGLALVHAGAALTLALFPIGIWTSLYVRVGLALFEEPEGTSNGRRRRYPKAHTGRR